MSRFFVRYVLPVEPQPVPLPTVAESRIETDHAILAAAHQQLPYQAGNVVYSGLVEMAGRLHRERLS